MSEEMKDWQRGISLELLKTYGAIFAGAHKEHVYGAFGLVKEREIAEAMSEDRFRTLGGAALIFRRMKSSSTRTSYYERPINILAGESIISAFATTNTHDGVALLEATLMELGHKAVQPGGLFPTEPEPATVWVEIFEEDMLAKCIIDEQGFKYVDSNVLAGSEIKGLYVRGRHVPAACDPPEFATLKILQPDFLTEQERGAILAELEAYGQWADHYSTYNKKHSWTALALRGYVPDDPGFIIRPDEMSRKWKLEHAELMSNKCWPTTAAPKFPVSLAIAGRIPGVKDRVRFMKLAPGGGELTRHADLLPTAGVADGRLARLHIPIVTNPDVLFTQWGARGRKVVKNFPERALCYLDQRQPHRALNGGTTERIHFVLDVESNATLRAMIAAGA